MSNVRSTIKQPVTCGRTPEERKSSPGCRPTLPRHLQPTHEHKQQEHPYSWRGTVPPHHIARAHLPSAPLWGPPAPRGKQRAHLGPAANATATARPKECGNSTPLVPAPNNLTQTRTARIVHAHTGTCTHRQAMVEGGKHIRQQACKNTEPMSAARQRNGKVRRLFTVQRLGRGQGRCSARTAWLSGCGG